MVWDGRGGGVVSVCRSWFFFFFQAEDGIRDLTVTGVQTCALPISSGQTRPGSLTDTLSRQPGAPRRRTGPPYASSAGWFLSPARPSGFLWSHPDRSTAASRDP